MTDKKVIEKARDHPLEGFFNIESETTMVPSVQRTSDVVESTKYDSKDTEIDKQFQEIYDTALEAYETQYDAAEMVEGRYKARTQEIAVQLLNTALNAAANKATLKTNKEKIRVAEMKIKGGVPTIDGDMVTGDRNAILKALKEAKKVMDKAPIEAER